MSFAPLEAVKKHPVLAIGVGVTAFAVILLLSSSGGSSQAVAAGQTTSGTATATDSMNQLQGMLASIAGQTQLAQIGAEASKQQNEAALEGLRIQGQTTNAANVLAAQIAQFQIAKESETTQQANTLQASVLNNQTNATVRQAEIASNTTIATTKTFTDALIAQSRQAVEIAGINAQGQVGVANAQRPCDSYLFGLITSC